MIYALDGIAPRIHPSAWIAPNAIVIGDVEIGAEASIWFGVVLRGDSNRIHVGARSNVQDNAVVHVNPAAEHRCWIGDDVLVGHAAIIHGCTLEDGAFVGMGATVLDGAVIEGGGVLAAGALLSPNKRLPAGELWAGAPARRVRALSEDERAGFALGAPSYAENARRFGRGLREV